MFSIRTNGVISLREAIWYADPESVGNHITFDTGLDDATLLLLGKSLVIDTALTIDASSLNSFTIDADGKSRVFTVLIAEEPGVELNGLTIRGGSADDGGGIYNFHGGLLTVTNHHPLGQLGE